MRGTFTGHLSNVTVCVTAKAGEVALTQRCGIRSATIRLSF